MDPITGGLIAGGASLLGSFLTNEQSARNASAQMDFQKYMSNTAHQREVDDLRRAGLNPILSAGGAGASTPGGAMAPVANLSEAISKGADTALGLRAQNKTLQAQDATIDNTKADTDNKAAQWALFQNQAASTAKDIQMKSSQIRLLNETLDSQIKKAKAEGDYSEINQLMGIINSGTSAAGNILGSGFLKNLLPPGSKK